MDAANFRFVHACGPVYGYITEAGVQQLVLPHPERPLQPYLLHSAPNKVVGYRLREALEAYFAGVPQDFAGIPIDLGLGTEFQRAVWQAARAAPYGRTERYGALTARIGRAPGAARAVGAALGANPVAILVPCHRYLGARGALTGFAAGIDWKRRLLEIEGALAPLGPGA